MLAAVVLIAAVGCAAAAPSILSLPDDGQWRPALDGSILGSGAIQWGLEDGSWKPALDGSVLGSGDLLWLNRRRRSLVAVNPNALPVPLDTATVALAKNAQLIQQQTEGTRNILGGGIPLALPADTPEVAVGKQAHAIAHATQAAATSGVVNSALIASPAAVAAVSAPAVIAASPLVSSGVIAASPLVSSGVIAASPLVSSGVIAAGPLGIGGIAGVHGLIG